MQTKRRWGALVGLVATLAGLAAAELVSGLLHQRVSPLVAVAEVIIDLTPGPIIEAAIQTFGTADKPLLVGGTLVGLLACGAVIGIVATRWLLAAQAAALLIGAVAGVAVADRLTTTPYDFLPVIIATGVTMVALAVLVTWVPRDAAVAPAGSRVGSGIAGSAPMSSVVVDPALRDRRSFLTVAGSVAVLALVAGVWGRALHQGRAALEAARRNLRLNLSTPRTPSDAEVAAAGVVPWITDQDDFYLIHTAISLPQILPKDWELRIHGLVDRELRLTYQDLLERGLTEAWITLCCVSNEVGGDLIGNARWAGVPVADILADAGVQEGADAVKTTSEDGWTCGTPLAALTDHRNALFALAMNGEPLTVEHGFPVRMVVPGLYGFVSATKWLVDLEVTRFDDFDAFWTQNGWAEQAEIKTQSRIDVPGDGSTVQAGEVAVGGVAWAQHRGITAVEVSVDAGPWEPAELGAEVTIDSWRQWVYRWTADPGEHELQVRATDATGEPQTEERVDPVPDGASGWHTISVAVT